MCQYFYKPAGVTIDEEKLRNSVINNPHGWGLIYRDKPSGKGPWPFVYMECEDPTKDTDPDTIVKLLNETLKDQEVYIHLRWVTAGERTRDNIHPFVIKDDGDDQLFLFHNGTIADFKPAAGDKRSDTAIFVEEVIKPLCHQLRAPLNWSSWKALTKIIHKLIGTWSRVMLVSSREKVPVLFNYDNHHFETVKIKKKNGKEKERFLWLSSNDYSFDPDHRKPKTPAKNDYYYYSGYGYGGYGGYGGSSSKITPVWYKDYINVYSERIGFKKCFVYDKESFDTIIDDLPAQASYIDEFIIGPGESPLAAIANYIKESMSDAVNGELMRYEPRFVIKMFDENGKIINGRDHGRTVYVYV